MLVRVGVFRRMAAGGDLEVPHRETRGGVVGTDQAAHAAARCPFAIDGSRLHLFAMDDFHDSSPFAAWARQLLRVRQSMSGCHAHACRGHVNRGPAQHAHGKRGHGTHQTLLMRHY